MAWSVLGKLVYMCKVLHSWPIVSVILYYIIIIINISSRCASRRIRLSCSQTNAFCPTPPPWLHTNSSTLPYFSLCQQSLVQVVFGLSPPNPSTLLVSTPKLWNSHSFTLSDVHVHLLHLPLESELCLEVLPSASSLGGNSPAIPLSLESKLVFL